MIKYRLALMGAGSTTQVVSCPTESVAHLLEASVSFIRWLNNWTEVEV